MRTEMNAVFLAIFNCALGLITRKLAAGNAKFLPDTD
jgi:hypothetical protein